MARKGRSSPLRYVAERFAIIVRSKPGRHPTDFMVSADGVRSLIGRASPIPFGPSNAEAAYAAKFANSGISETVVDVRGNRPTDPVWAASLKPGWQQQRSWNFTYWTSGIRDGADMIADGWTSILAEPTGGFGGSAGEVDPEEMRRAEMRKMGKVRSRIDEAVEDPATAKGLVRRGRVPFSCHPRSVNQRNQNSRSVATPTGCREEQ